MTDKTDIKLTGFEYKLAEKDETIGAGPDYKIFLDGMQVGFTFNSLENHWICHLSYEGEAFVDHRLPFPESDDIQDLKDFLESQINEIRAIVVGRHPEWIRIEKEQRKIEREAEKAEKSA